jgi:hypothetical protein
MDRQALVLGAPHRGGVSKKPFLVAEKGSGQGYFCQLGRSLDADRHGSSGRCAYRMHSHADVTRLGLPHSRPTLRPPILARPPEHVGVMCTELGVEEVLPFAKWGGCLVR